jgi:tRNA pseudouridine32 synthase / 23S rRNA pseudouridine746 synthase
MTPAQPLATRLLYQDPDVVVIDKPAGLPCHGGPRATISVESQLPALAQAIGQKRPLFLAHRLDQDTSGCLAIACGERAHKLLANAFAQRQVRKTYWAWVAGTPSASEGLVDAPLHKVSSAAKGWRMLVNRQQGQAARTAWRVLERRAGQTLLELTPETGRTHQLRVHCAHIGHPIVGDPVYGQAMADLRLQLHARSLELTQPRSQAHLHILCPAPADFIS